MLASESFGSMNVGGYIIKSSRRRLTRRTRNRLIHIMLPPKDASGDYDPSFIVSDPHRNGSVSTGPWGTLIAGLRGFCS